MCSMKSVTLKSFFFFQSDSLPNEKEEMFVKKVIFNIARWEYTKFSQARTKNGIMYIFNVLHRE